MTHPCDGHACDHCYACDVEGRCCMCDPPSAPALGRDRQVLMDAIRADSATASSLSDLVRLDRLLALSAQSVAPDPVLAAATTKALTSSPELPTTPITQNQKENRHV